MVELALAPGREQIVEYFTAAKDNTLNLRLIQIIDFIHYIIESAPGKILNSGNRFFVAQQTFGRHHHQRLT